jgi:hypothetical protein
MLAFSLKIFFPSIDPKQKKVLTVVQIRPVDTNALNEVQGPISSRLDLH